jgi:predicted nucleic-acid-binding Zn-ribbon protein
MENYKIKRCPECGSKNGEFRDLVFPIKAVLVRCNNCAYTEWLDDALNSGFAVKEENTFKVFISLPMRGLTLKQVKYNYEQAKMNISNMSLADKDGNIVDCDDLYFFDNIQEDLDPETSRSLDYLSNDVKMLGDADLVYFVSGWEKSRGCNIEYQICKDWDIPMIFEQGGI